MGWSGVQSLLGKADGRTSAALACLGARTQAFRDGVEVVVIDPHPGYPAALDTPSGRPMPEAQLAVK